MNFPAMTHFNFIADPALTFLLSLMLFRIYSRIGTGLKELALYPIGDKVSFTSFLPLSPS